MKTKIYQTIDQEFMKQWLSLWEKSPFANYTNSGQWFTSVIETFRYKDFVILALYQKEKLIAVGGLVIEKKYGITCYTVAPGDFVCGIPFLIDLDNKHTVRRFCKALIELGTICLENIPEEFMISLKATAEINERKSTSNYFVQIQKDEEGNVIVPHKRRLLRRSEDIEKDLVLQSALDKKYLEKAFEIDAKSGKQALGYNAFSNLQTVRFYRTLEEKFGQNFLLFILEHKKKAIAYQIGFQIGNTFFCSQIASLKEYEVYSVGRSLLIKVIEHLGKKDVTNVDFGSGEDHVKRSLTKQQRQLYFVVLGKSKLRRDYIIYISKSRDYLYNQLHKNKKIYGLYRKIKRS